MIQRFPRQATYLERTRLLYADLSNLVSAGRTARDAQVAGFVVVHLGSEEQGWFLVQDGVAVAAALLSPTDRRLVSVDALLEHARRELDRGEVAFYGAPQSQLCAMYATLAAAPVLQVSRADLDRPERLLLGLGERGFDGVLELLRDGDVGYVVLRGGNPEAAYVTDRGEGESPAAALERFVRGAGPDGLQLRGYAPVDALPVHASAALIRVYLRLLDSTLKGCAARIGAQPAAECFQHALRLLGPAWPELRGLRVDDEGVGGTAEGTVKRLTAAVAAWLLEALSTASRTGELDPMDVLGPAAAADRHVLEANGLFAHLPWPLSC